MSFKSLSKTLKIQVKKIINNKKYGDNQRVPFAYLPTNTSVPPSSYLFPQKLSNESFKEKQYFPKLSEEILFSLFKNIGVHYVPEITRYELKQKTALKSFQDFCFTFGMEEEWVNSHKLNNVIKRLKEMDSLRNEIPFDSRAIYSALAYYDLSKADKLIDKMKKGKTV